MAVTWMTSTAATVTINGCVASTRLSCSVTWPCRRISTGYLVQRVGIDAGPHRADLQRRRRRTLRAPARGRPRRSPGHLSPRRGTSWSAPWAACRRSSTRPCWRAPSCRRCELAPALRERARLVMVGDGPLRAECQAVLDAARPRRLAWLPGERSDVPDVMRGLDAFVLPSLAEGISNTILEAMASGLPVIATDVGGNAELVGAGRRGHLVPSDDVDAMAQAMVATGARTLPPRRPWAGPARAEVETPVQSAGHGDRLPGRLRRRVAGRWRSAGLRLSRHGPVADVMAAAVAHVVGGAESAQPPYHPGSDPAPPPGPGAPLTCRNPEHPCAASPASSTPAASATRRAPGAAPHERVAAPPRPRRRQPAPRARRRPGPPAAVDHRPRHRPAAAVQRGRLGRSSSSTARSTTSRS